MEFKYTKLENKIQCFLLILQTLRPIPIVLVTSEQLLTFGANFWQLRAIFASLNNFWAKYVFIAHINHEEVNNFIES